MSYSVKEIQMLIEMGFTPELIAKMSGGSVATKTTTKKPTGAKAPTKPQPKAEPKTDRKTKSYSTDIKDYEPKAQDGNYNWASYKAQRTKYCYSVATNGACNSNPYGTEWEGKVDYSPNSPYYKAKAEFEKTYKYITKANR